MMPDPCRELEDGLRYRVTYGMDRATVLAWLDGLTNIEDCIAGGLYRARQVGDWEMFEKYAFAADRHPSELYTQELCHALRRHRDEINVEDIIFTLAGIRDPTSIHCLEELLWWEPEWDEYRHVAIKAVWALAAIGTREAMAVVRSAASCGAGPIREAAAQELRRIGEEPCSGSTDRRL